MAARLPTACLVLAALCGVGWCVSAAAAKPPDLPIDEKIYCAPGMPPDGAVPAAPGEDDDVHVRAAQLGALRTASRCVLFAAHPLLALLPVEEWLADAEEQAEAPAPVSGGYVLPPAGEPANDFTCPYLREKADREQDPSCPQTAVPGSVLENLEKLEQAARVYREAGAARRAGQFEDARKAYESIRQLCPGSRYDRLACEQLVHPG